jgi:hypothetical protein
MKTIRIRFAGSRFPNLRAYGLFLMAACALVTTSAWADTKLVTSGSPARILVPTDGSLGGTWRNPGFNDSSWMQGSNGVGYEVNPGSYTASVIADSQGEWSTAGQQGENSWINGYYDLANDADATYQVNDFQPFPRTDGPYGPENFWNGGAWVWFREDPNTPPWDTIGSTDVHPNGINQPQGEHWVIRRWVSTASGAITIRFHVRKTNPGGTGVTGKILKNGTEIFTRAIAGGDQTGFEAYVHTTAAPGDIFDFAHTPVGLGGDPGDGADGSIMTATILSGTVTPPPPPVTQNVVADSEADWSGTGVQGANGWYYGYYDRTADADGTYDPNTEFNMTDPNWTFRNGGWELGVTGDLAANPPWDTIGQSGWHPNGDNQPQGIHWVIRRWVSDVDGDLHAQVKFAKANTSGNGTTLHVLHNGTEVFSSTLNNTAGISNIVLLPGVLSGDKIEFALDPKGVDGLFGDGADSSTFSTKILSGPPPQMEVANSVTDWSATGVQGANGWYYGFYNETADANATYDPSTDFNMTDPNWNFSGIWRLGVTGDPAADPPWDIIGETEWHPNGDNNEHVDWVIRRWVSDVDGDLHANVQFGKDNINGGNGTTLRVLHNGTQRFSYTVAFNNRTGINSNVNLPGVLIGDTIEFALDPLGTDGTKGDGADGSLLRASIRTGLAPEPPKPFVPGVADCFITDIENAMKGVNPSVYIRIPFNVSNPAAIDTLKLKLKYNDGFAAYLNGVEVGKRNAPTAIAGITVADSMADWSNNPDVTVNGWSYGYYDQSLDSDGTYSGGSDLTPFPHDGGGYSATDFWNPTANGYDWFQGNPPWTELYSEGTHPNHPNGAAVDPNNVATHQHWTIRRWTATVDANLKARIRFRKTNAGCGDGVRVMLFHGASQVYSQTIQFNDTIGRDDTVDLPDVFIGDSIDILLGPGDANDFCDGSAFSLVLFEGEPTIPWNGAATASRTTTETITPSVFDLTSFIPQLTAGANVLAIQGFNAAVSDNEFVINAELLANQLPTAVNDTVAAAVDTTTTYTAATLLANDIDPDGDRLLLVGVSPGYTTAQGGAVRLYGDTVRYTPAAGFTGADTFQYTMTDLSGTPTRASVSVNVRAANRPPVASPDTATTAEETPVTIAVLANDSDPDGDALSVTAVTSPAHGTAVIASGTVTYTPSANYNGPDSFTYTISDGAGGTASATVNVTVTPVNDCPTANPATATVNTGSSVNLQLTGSDPDGDALTFAVVQSPAHGTVTLQAAGAATYTPAAGYCGPDSFTFRVSDGGCSSTSATVSITVSCGTNLPPTGCVAGILPAECVITGSDGTLSVVSVNGTNACVTLQGSATDPEGQTLSYSWWSEGAVFATGASVTACLEVGCRTVSFVAMDPNEASCTTTLNICVVTAADAVEQCIDLVDSTDLDRKNKRPLIATLKAAAAAFERGNTQAALNQLSAFQNKVRAQIGRTDPAAAEAFTECAQQIMDAVGCGAVAEAAE